MSLVEHLLGILFEFWASVHVTRLLGGWSPIGLLVDNHALSARSWVVLLCSRAIALIRLVASCSLIGRGYGAAWLLPNDVHHAILERLFVLWQPVLLPSVVEDARIHVVPRQAALEKSDARPVVRLLLEFERTAIFHELSELGGVAAAELLQRRFDLLFLDIIVLLILWSTGQALPGQLTLYEVEKHVANCFQVVSPWLFNTFVSGYRGVPGRSCQVFAIFVGDVLALTVLVALCEAEIYDVDVVSTRFCASDQEIVWLDISVDDSLFMHFFDALDQLNGDH